MILFSCVENEIPDPQVTLDGELKITITPVFFFNIH